MAFILLAVPDLGWWILVTMSLVLITGLLRGALVFRTLKQANVDVPQSAPTPA